MRRLTSLRWKFTAVVTIGTLMSATLVAAGFSWRDLNRFWERTEVDVSALASIVSSQLGAAVMLRDTRSTSEVLDSLSADGRIRLAVVYGPDKSCFSMFSRDGLRSCPAQPGDGIQRTARTLIVTRSIKAADERIGTLSVAADTPTIGELLRMYFNDAALVVVLSLMLSAAIALMLQARVSAPILAIAHVAREMAETRRFGKKVSVKSSDEVGALAASFNLMIEELEKRDAALNARREELEWEVIERTRVNAELQVAKEKAEVGARVKAEFLANMSHEIRTPLNGVSGMITLALATSTEEPVRDQLRMARTASESLIRIVNDILDFSKIEAGKMSLDRIDFDLRKAVQECLELFEITAREKRLSLQCKVSEDCSGWVHGDPVRLRQVLINLIGNAVKFTEHGEVRVNVCPGRAGVIQFEVADTGIGIPADKLKSIFNAFTQADGSHTRRFGGTGLGLAITERLVALMSGELRAESEQGVGSRFFVTLPLPAVARPITAPLADADQSDIDISSGHVLLAEDNLVNQKVVCGLLGQKGWTVRVAGDGETAYRMFLNDRFDLILMDVQMPGIDGLEATRIIRREERQRGLKPTPIIALTAHASPAEHQQCISTGMDAVVVKPLNVPEFYRCIRRAVRASRVATSPVMQELAGGSVRPQLTEKSG